MTDDAFARRLRDQLEAGGLSGSFLVRDLDTGEELGIDADETVPIASLVKLPLAIATVGRIARGELDGAALYDVDPGRITTPGPMGISRFRHPARVALDDLVYLTVAVSDGSASDVLFELTPPDMVAAELARIGVAGIAVRHTAHAFVETPLERLDADDAALAYDLAIGADSSPNGHRLPQLDVSVANSGSARALIDLVQALWMPTAIAEPVAARVRELMASNVVRWRLAPDFASDASTWASKTGTLLNLRHEVGVVEHRDGARYAVAALTRSGVAAASQPAAEALMASVARSMRDRLRAR
ncbi:serine hydrolase [Frondihabitans sp. PAMC 28766]|nr:serine hydrolase [Frondihabitans sp. PAMC 28766]